MSDELLAADPYVAAFPEHLPFWQAAERGVLLLPRCARCGQTHWHPRASCPFCRATEVGWHAASGRATLYTYSVIARPDGATVLAYVQLAEGPLMMSNVVDANPEALAVGAALEVAFRRTMQGRSAPVWRLGPNGPVS
jgi:uncharacterized OB-fold protein